MCVVIVCIIYVVMVCIMYVYVRRLDWCQRENIERQVNRAGLSVMAVGPFLAVNRHAFTPHLHLLFNLTCRSFFNIFRLIF